MFDFRNRSQFRMRPLTWVLLTLLLVICLGAAAPYLLEVEGYIIEGSTIFFAAIILLIGMLLIRRLNRRLEALAEVAGHIGRGNYLVRSSDEGRDSVGAVAGAVNAMVDKIQSSVESLEEKQLQLEESRQQLELQNQQLSGEQARQESFGRFLSQLNSVDTQQIARCGLRFLEEQTGALLGQFYLHDEGGLNLAADRGIDRAAMAKLGGGDGQGLPAEALRRGEWVVFEAGQGLRLPTLNLGVSRIDANTVVAAPIQFQGKSLGVLLMAYLEPLDTRLRIQIQSVVDALGGSLNNAMTYKMVQRQALKLEQANQELLEADRLRSEFVANMSHELRTPLNSVIGFSSVLMKNRNHSLVEKDLDFVEKIHRNGRHLLGLINDILDLSKIEAGRLEIDWRPSSVQEVVKETSELLQSQAEARHVDLKVDIVDRLPLVETDSDKLRQVLINLVGNALKFTERGGVTLKLSRDGAEARIDVMDTGIGIPADKLDTVFEPFRQADAGTTRKYGGTGLGLAITKSIVEMLEGRMGLDSREGQGSTFTVWLPLDRAGVDSAEAGEVASTSPVPRQTAGVDINGRKVLIIDDDDEARELTADVLREAGASVLFADSGSQGLKVARLERPDLITLDIMMPGMNGWETLRALKDDDELNRIPVVVLSIIAEKRQAAVLGAVDALAKPLAPEQLLAAVGRVLSRPDIQNMTLLVVDNSREARELYRLALEDRVAQIHYADNGESALQLIESEVPDLVFLDLILPGMDGLAVLRHLRLDKRLFNLPVVIVTSRQLSSEERNELETRAAEIVDKGEEFDKNRLLETIERALSV
ncbi:MAG: response regulator [Pseudomonadota bacterium]